MSPGFCAPYGNYRPARASSTGMENSKHAEFRGLKNFTDSMAYSIDAGIFMSQSDALEKRSKWMGVQAAVEWAGDTARNIPAGQNISLFPKARLKTRMDPLTMPEADNVHKKPFTRR